VASVAVLLVANLMLFALVRASDVPAETVWLVVASANALLVVCLVVLKVIMIRQDRDLAMLQRQYQSLTLVSSDRDMETGVLETLSEVSAAFLEKMELEPLLTRMSKAVQDILKVDISVIELLPEPRGERISFVRGTDRVVFGEQLYEEVVGRGRSLLVNDLAHYPRYVSLSEQGLQAMVVAPFRSRGRVIGFVGAFTRGAAGFSGRELRMLHTFANHAALLIETTQLLDAVRKLSLKTGTEMITDLRGLTERLSFERAAADREMEIARRIQTDLLPKKSPSIPNLQVEAISVPAKEVGGDYYDFIDLGGGRWGIAIADVSGKGVPAALVMAMTHSLLRVTARQNQSPATVLSLINQTLYEETDPQVFVSMLYGIWDVAAGRFVYANAGHERPLLLRASATACEVLTPGGIALGATPDASGSLQDCTVELHPGDALVLYTDGVTEAMDARGQMLGAARLREAIQSIRDGIVDAIMSQINAFTGTATQYDDITIVGMKGR
jgi:hypothetical protein